MGNILNGGILEKIRGNSDRVVISFCEHIESTHLSNSYITIIIIHNREN
jgi:hypothetical protein